MISLSEYARTRNAVLEDAADPAIVAKYSYDSETAELVEKLNELFVDAASKGRPFVRICAAHVTSALADCEGCARSDISTQTCAFICVKVVEWMRRNTMFRMIAWTGDGWDFIVEP